MNTLIILNGKKPSAKLLNCTAKNKDLIICADGGAKWVDRSNIHVDVIIGDFDSVDKSIIDKYKETDVKIITAPVKKDETDGVLAVDYAINSGSTNIEILGSNGGRLDHQLGNIMLLKRILDAGCTGKLVFKNGYAIMSGKPIKLSTISGSTISVIPFCGDVKIEHSSGFKYPITLDTKFTYNYPIGISNVAATDTIELKIISGYVVIFIYDC